jgi:hypothetical protein
MEANWAAEHLQVIRTLMERSALYRRALAPIMIYNGVIGLAAAALGWGLRIVTPHGFILYWAGMAVLAMAGSFLLVRRQALRESEPFWSPPTRRVTQALVPPLVAGLIVTAGAFVREAPIPGLGAQAIELWVPLSWVLLYGCAFHSASSFMPRGMKLFGWAFIVAGSTALAAELAAPAGPARHLDCLYAIMGFFFGLLHLGYGAYLYVTEQRGKAT